MHKQYPLHISDKCVAKENRQVTLKTLYQVPVFHSHLNSSHGTTDLETLALFAEFWIDPYVTLIIGALNLFKNAFEVGGNFLSSKLKTLEWYTLDKLVKSSYLRFLEIPPMIRIQPVKSPITDPPR